MSEPKRVSFTTVSNVATSFGGSAASSLGAGGLSVSGSATAAASLRFGSEFPEGPEKAANNGGSSGAANAKGVGSDKTIRLTLELFPSDTCSYPEFNYAKLMHLEKKKIKKLKQKTNGLSDPFEENDQDVARIAKALENKYGSTYASGRGGKKDDHCDIGLGYDESDSFIDNTEAYDEVVPEEVETIEGGFYINCGPLEFKKLHGESTTTKTDEIIKMPNRPKKRVFSTSEDSSSSDKDEGDEANCDDDDEDDDEEDDSDSDNETEEKSAPESGKEKDVSYKGQPPEKRKKIEIPAVGTVVAAGTNGGDKKLKDSQQRKSKQFGLTSSSSSNSPKIHVEEIHGSDSEKERKTIKTTTVKDMLKAKRDNFLKMQGSGANGSGVGATSKSSDEDESSSDDDDDDDNNDSDDSHPNAEQRQQSVQNSDTTEKIDTILPFDLHPDHVARITQFSEFVMSKNMTGKKFQLDGESMEMFVKIEESLPDKSVRTKVFAHLEYRLQLPKYYFLRKMKQQQAKQEKLKIQRASTKLRKAIMETMPSAYAAHELELIKSAELQQDKVNDDKPPKIPKKKFPWTASLRQLLYEVYAVRKQSFSVLGTRKETLSDFINSYLRGKIVELWPIGWMRFEELQREIEKYIVNDQVSNGGGISTADDYDTIMIGQSDTDSRTSSASGTGHNEIKPTRPPNAKKQPQKNKIDKKQRVVDASNNISTQMAPQAIEVVNLVSPPTGKPDVSDIYKANVNHGNVNALLQMQQQLLKHSKADGRPTVSSNPNPNIAVIDLDKLTSANDILETTKMMNAISAANVHHHQQQQQKTSNSSESDSVEFVSAYPSPQPRTSFVGGPMTPAGVKNKSKKNDFGKQQKGPHTIDPLAGNIHASNNNIAIKMENNLGKSYQPNFQHTNINNKSPKVSTSLGTVNKETNR